jgi:DNA repair exonuclease SbcCD ATPase subunit
VSAKSSIPEIMVYTLYGKTIKQPKKLTHKNVINNQIGKKLRTEVRWGDFRVVRTRKPDSLRIWESENGDWSGLEDKEWEEEHEISLGGMPATQKLIEEKLGLNYETFVNVVVFTDNNSGSFLECDTPTKREIVENLLSLDRYRQFTDIAKKMRNGFKDKVKTLGADYDRSLQQVEEAEERVKEAEKEKAQWIKNKKTELADLIQQAKAKKEALESTEEGEALSRYEEAQQQIKQITTELPELEEKRTKLDKMLETAESRSDEAKEKVEAVNQEISQHKSAIKAAEQFITDNLTKIDAIESQKGAKCDFCHSVVSEENYGPFTLQLKNKVEHQNGVIVDKTNLLELSQTKLTKLKAGVDKIREAIGVAKGKRKTLIQQIATKQAQLTELNSISKPESKDVANTILQKEIAALGKQIIAKKEESEGSTPYEQIIASAEANLKTKKEESKAKKKQLDKAEEELPYYEFWVKAFGDSGIRKYVIDGIVPALNSRIAHWLQFLIDGKITLVFDNELDETIERNPPDGDPFVYAQMSCGEQRRLNLSVSQGFAHLMMLNVGVLPSGVFLDEVSTNIDPMGVVGIYNMILELSQDRQVFVTTHDQGLLDMLEGCDCIVLQKKDGFTKLIRD